MIAYIDSSVLLRIVLKQDDALPEWKSLHGGVCNDLLFVESRRTLDRYWRQDLLNDTDLATKIAETEILLQRLDKVRLTRHILYLAAQPYPAILGTLDAIHLASALSYRAIQPPNERPIYFATHDVQLARAARAMNFEVLGA